MAEVRNVVDPNLPLAPTAYAQQWQDDLLRTLRLYFATLNNAINSSINATATSGDDTVSYALQYDQDADPPSYAYLGQAVPGSAASSAVWRIQKLTFSAGGDVSTTWADGNANFDNVWDNRASLSYS